MAYQSLSLLLISTGISLLIGTPLIKFLKSTKIKQFIREDGPPTHIKTKSSTPTAGGVIFLIPVLCIACILFFTTKQFQTKDFCVVLSITLIMSAIGLLDDYLKIIKKQNKGISGYLKLFVQLLVSVAVVKIYSGHIGLIYLIWTFFVISGSTNSYNLTDGLDGLVISISLASFAGLFFLLNQYNKPELVIFTAIFFGGLLGFLYFNRHPAKVFMGDSGSLAIGGAIGSLAIVSKSEWYLALFATIPILEALSVIIQVVVYQFTKRTFGKAIRVFKMAPIHHHFELCGWKETDIVKRFFIFQVVCVVIGILILKLT